MAQNPEQTINEMTSLDLNQQPLCIEYPTLDVDFELKSGLIHLLPTFRGLAGLSEVNRSLVDAASEGHLSKHLEFEISSDPISLLRQSFGIPSGKELQLENNTTRGHTQQRKTEDESSVVRGQRVGKIEHEFKISPNQDAQPNQVDNDIPKVFVPKPPFPERFAKSKKEKEILETFTQSRAKAMCDLGASINVMPLAIYESLNVGRFKNMGVVLQLVDRSIVYPEGVLENVLVQVNELVFPADFYVLDMTGDNSPNSISILLGRPFRETSKTKIDCFGVGTLFMEFNNEVVSFSIGGVTQNSNDMHYIFFMDFIDLLVQGNATFDGGEHPR
ncbi:UNVERIFIED_CONTAM: hypothetical protein Sangu_2439400 [Sesamum angustifolium]|uniref:Uncharacterized protein n=1 Tax=Sesamum angustifolium TaxID=2727405 RepID=A0AAW2KWV3_9LAMI